MCQFYPFTASPRCLGASLARHAVGSKTFHVTSLVTAQSAIYRETPLCFAPLISRFCLLSCVGDLRGEDRILIFSFRIFYYLGTTGGLPATPVSARLWGNDSELNILQRLKYFPIQNFVTSAFSVSSHLRIIPMLVSFQRNWTKNLNNIKYWRLTGLTRHKVHIDCIDIFTYVGILNILTRLETLTRNIISNINSLRELFNVDCNKPLVQQDCHWNLSLMATERLSAQMFLFQSCRFEELSVLIWFPEIKKYKDNFYRNFQTVHLFFNGALKSYCFFSF